jgi:hypothetical protein
MKVNQCKIRGREIAPLSFFNRSWTNAASGISIFHHPHIFSSRTGARQIAQKIPEIFLFFVHFAY